MQENKKEKKYLGKYLDSDLNVKYLYQILGTHSEQIGYLSIKYKIFKAKKLIRFQILDIQSK